jgi:hypothetical protein
MGLLLLRSASGRKRCLAGFQAWQATVAWLVVTAVAALFYFAPVARLIDGLSY